MDEQNARLTKRRLRALVKRRWQRLEPALRHELNHEAVERLAAEPWLVEAQTVFLFAADEFELDAGALVELFPNKCFAFPEIIDDQQIIFRQVARLAALRPGRFGLLTPPVEAPETAPGDGDVMLVPALAADAACGRLGRGKGYYDRFLAAAPKTKTLCIVPFFAFFQALPLQPHDQKPDRVLVIGSQNRLTAEKT